MAGTRSSSRLAAKSNISVSASGNDSHLAKASGTKRKTEAKSSPIAKRGKREDKSEQKTIEETLNTTKPESDVATDDENGVQESSENDIKPVESRAKTEEVKTKEESSSNTLLEPPNSPTPSEEVATSSEDKSKLQDDRKQDDPPKTQSSPKLQNGDNAVDPKARDDETPSSILEKGVIYFLFRGRVGIDEPDKVNEIARSYMVMRPLPHGAKLGEGPIGEDGNCRLLVLPKKVLPRSPKDRFMVFVEKSKTSFKDLRETFSASDYDTKTAGVRHSPAATPVAEGVYAITTTGRESHLAYIVTIPAELGEVQKDIGIRERGSFLVSAKNPQYPGPANASLPQGPAYPQEILDEFRSLRWMPLQPKLLDYVHTQFLVIGESGGFDKAVESQSEDEKQDKDTPLEEMEKLEGEDQIRVKHLKGDDSVFTDLELSSKEYPKVPSTW